MKTMKNKGTIVGWVIIALAVAMLIIEALTIRQAQAISTPTQATSTAPIQILNHPQLVYTYSLEWCESHGVITAVNPKDSDGTPSYYSWQWKPSTFRYFGIKYGVLATSTTQAEASIAMHDYDNQRKVIEAMVADSKHINWHQQFPDCTRKIGLPPVIINS